MSIIKIDYLVAIFFQISYSLVLKIGICLKYFLDKNPKKQQYWYIVEGKTVAEN